MNGGIFVNLFEIQLPKSLEIYSQTWNNTSIQDIYSRMYPVNVYGDNNLHKLFFYGNSLPNQDIDDNFSIETIDTRQNSKFVARFLIDAITYFLQMKGYELSKRPYTSYKREIFNTQIPLKNFYQSLAIYQAYNIQVTYLNLDETLRYFLIVAPKLHHHFVIPLERFTKKVDCTGRFIKITCPTDCNLYTCELHRWRGRLAGRFDGFASEGLDCKFLISEEEPNSHISLYDARFKFNIPSQVCNLEASLSNIGYVYEKVFDKKKVNDLIRQIKILSGDFHYRTLFRSDKAYVK